MEKVLSLWLSKRGAIIASRTSSSTGLSYCNYSYNVETNILVLHIFSYRLQKAITNQTKTSSLSQQVNLNFHRAVDMHNKALMFVNSNITKINIYLYINNLVLRFILFVCED